MIDISTKILTVYLLMNLTLDRDGYQKNNPIFKSISIEGITFYWKFSKDFLDCRLEASTEGWVAVGFNTSNQLEGTNLIMGAVKNETVIIQDRFIIKPGLHQSIKELGGSDSILKKMGYEINGSTEISFSIPLSVNDKYHYNLIEGESIFILLAHSTDDDFSHHSRIRKTIKIKL